MKPNDYVITRSGKIGTIIRFSERALMGPNEYDYAPSVIIGFSDGSMGNYFKDSVRKLSPDEVLIYKLEI